MSQQPRETVFGQNEMQDLYAPAPILRQGTMLHIENGSNDLNKEQIKVCPLQLHLEQSHDFKAREREDVGVIRG